MDWVECYYCSKRYLKQIRLINENKKFGYRSYCSSKCQIAIKSRKLEFTCNNPNCQNKFQKQPKNISPNNYCSRSCAVSINNTKFPKSVAEVKRCDYCNERLSNYRKYCSIKCKSDALTIRQEAVIDRIKGFYKKHGRIPVKREMEGIYKPARKYFGTWNNSIEAAGFEPNPVLFAKRQIANDGHICDSMAEKMIDDYLSGRRISHERTIPYPGGIYTADFKIGFKLIEYFGLAGEHKRYDEIRIVKQKMGKKLKLGLIEVYPKDLYPKSRLEKVLAI